MRDALKTLFTHQYEAALSMLKACIDGCPDAAKTPRRGPMIECQSSRTWSSAGAR
jgi:hypothetical protein